ncbi:hypothetical protein LTR41_004748 [Exophiala xenobiotica]|nr:hypothetical protein LTR41_004748 [Exophiala xenobiotica]
MFKFAKVKPTPSSNSFNLEKWNSPSQRALKRTIDKKRTHSPDEDAQKPSSKTGKVRSETTESRVTGAVKLRTAWESPWKQYEKVYDLELAGAVEVAVRKTAPIHLVHVRKFSNAESEKVLHLFRQLQHRNIVTALDVFADSDGLYVVLEHMSIALERIVNSPAYPTEQQLAAILGQLLNGIVYLAEEGFEHGRLSCSNILLNTDGTLKIGENCPHGGSIKS